MKATDTFRHPIYRHNCAQAIANKWCHLFPQGSAIVDEYAPLIGGKAPGGLCGALYAAMQACPAHAKEIKDEFEAATGATTCWKIKGEQHTPCHVCVETADSLLEKFTARK